MTPDYKIIVNGKDRTAIFRERLVKMVIKDETGSASDSLTIEVSDALQEIPIPRRGVKITVYAGYVGQSLALMGSFTVDNAGFKFPADTISIKASGAAFTDGDNGKALQDRKTRSWPAGTLGSMVSTICAEHDIEPAITDSAAAIALPHIDQTDESDIHMLIRLASSYDLIVKPAFGKIIVMVRSETTTPAGRAINLLTIKRSEVTSGGMDWGEKTSYSRVITFYNDEDTLEQKTCDAGSGDPAFRVPNPYPDRETALTAAKSLLKIYQRSGANFNLQMPGRPEIFADGWLNFIGFRDEMNGDNWQVVTVTNTISNSSFTTAVDGRSMVTNA